MQLRHYNSTRSWTLSQWSQASGINFGPGIHSLVAGGGLVLGGGQSHWIARLPRPETLSSQRTCDLQARTELRPDLIAHARVLS